MFYIGEIVQFNNADYIVIDTDFIQQAAKIGIADKNNIVWESIWVQWANLQKKSPAN